MSHSYLAGYIKVKGKLSPALFTEIVANRTVKAIVGIIFFVGNIIVKSFDIASRKTHIGKINKYYQAFFHLILVTLFRF